MDIFLPPGGPATWDNDEWCCEKCPNPKCDAEGKFNWNLKDEHGACFVCGFAIKGYSSLKYWYRNESLEEVTIVEKPREYSKQTSKYLTNAWDFEKSRKFLQSRNASELVSRKYGFLYNPEENRMYLDINPISPDMPKVHLSRYMGPTGKWFFKKGTKGIYYAWGWEKFVGTKKNILVCEGIFDLVSTKLDHKGIATLGSHPHDNFFQWMSKHINKVTFWFDADEAGVKAAKYCSEKCLFYSIPFSVVKTKSHPKAYDRRLPGDRKLLEHVEALIDRAPEKDVRRYLIR